MRGVRPGEQVVSRGDSPCWSHLLADEARPDLTDDVAVELLLRRVYRGAAADPVLGPVIERGRLDWRTVVPRGVDHWTHQLLGDRAGGLPAAVTADPMCAKLPLSRAQLARWSALFADNVDAWFSGPLAERAKQRAAELSTFDAAG